MIQRSLYLPAQVLAGTVALLFASGLAAQDSYQVRSAERRELPLLIDSNTPLFWYQDQLRLFSSTSTPMVTTLGEEFRTEEVRFDSDVHFPLWIESVYQSGDGRLYAWYHHEQLDVCPGTTFTAPAIGALVSDDGGTSFRDLGIVLTSGEPVNCGAQNGYFATGVGDFSVIASRDGNYLYFLFGQYGGPVASQGVAMARMAVEDLDAPVGAVWKYHSGSWTEPGLGGVVTPIFPAAVGWQSAETDAFWGPSVHWNTHLQKFVVLMNRSCCSPGWPQEGIYLTMNADLENPAGWSRPEKILELGDWYPWAWGTGERETNTEAGKVVRLFVRNASEWEIVFRREDEPEEAPPTEPEQLHSPENTVLIPRA